MPMTKGVTIAEMMEQLEFKLFTPTGDLQRRVTSIDINRPGLALGKSVV